MENIVGLSSKRFKKAVVKVSHKFYLFFPLLLFFLILLSWYWYQLQLKPVSSFPKQTDFIISRNESATSILNRLETQGFIRSALAAKVFLRFNGNDKKLIPGSFMITPELSTKEILDLLSRGPKDLWVTIPEGWRREQIGLRFATILGDKSNSFNLNEFLSLSASLEGQLFPDTYLISPDPSTASIISLLVNTFNKKTGYESNILDKKVLIIASLIEREAKSDPDRAIISGIIHKRLDNKWPLQIDATIQYASDTRRCQNNISTCNWWQPIGDTKINSTYNTYQNLGLPPMPICNPGLASINAAKFPILTAHWYYLTGTDGQTYYADTLADHNHNIDKHLKH